MAVSKAAAAGWQRTYQEAWNAGVQAAEKVTPVPMVVEQHARVMDDNSPVVQRWLVAGGPCGFAWVHLKGNTGFAKWLKENKMGHQGYPGGWDIPVHAYNQSIQLKETHARAMADVFRKYGLVAYAHSRDD